MIGSGRHCVSFQVVIKALIALFPRQISFSTSWVSGAPPGYDGA
jgi:hypothetical protein